MRNLLKSNLSAVWNGTNKLNENNTGGVALWTTPPRVHNAFNPSVFVRTKYLHVTDGYTPDHSYKPNYVSIDNSEVQLVFQDSTKSTLYIEFTAHKDGEEVTNVVVVYAGTTTWRMSDTYDSLASIDRIGLTREELSTDPVSDSSYVYLRQGQSYEDSCYICRDKDNILYRNDDVERTSLVVYLKGGATATLSAETFRGKVMFDISEIVKSNFKDHLLEFKDGLSLLADLSLYCKYSVKGIAGASTISEFMAVNAVSQIGESFDRAGDKGKVLTSLPMLLKYDGYPLDYSVLSTETSVETANGKTSPYSISRVQVGAESELNLRTEASEDVLDEARRNIKLMSAMDIRIYRAQTPPQPFYVRWINTLGGVDYFMFSRQQKRANTIKSVSTFNPYISDTETAKTNRLVYAMDTDSTITVGAEMLSPDVFATLHRMPFSPLIEWFNEETGKWVRLSVNKFDGQYYSKPETKGVEVTFSLPSINIQY